MTLAQYTAMVDALRERRRDPSWAPADDREPLAALEDAFDALSPEDQATASDEGWRGWPDLYDARVTALDALADAGERAVAETFPVKEG